MRSRIAMLSAVATVVMGIAVTLPAKADTGPTKPGSSVASSAEPSSVASSAEALTQLSGRARALVADAPGFAGLWVDQGGRVHVRFTPGAGPEPSAAVRKLSPDIDVAATARYSYDELVAKRDTVTATVASLRNSGIEVVDWGPVEANNSLEVSVKTLTPEAILTLRQLFGTETVVTEAAETGPDPLFSTRWADNSPYAAGIELNNGSGDGSESCTSGMGLYFNGAWRLVTAGHCFDSPAIVGAKVYNGSTYIGTKNWKDTAASGTDTAIVTAPGSAYLYRTDTTYYANSHTPWNSSVGQTVCMGGAYSGEVCVLKVIATNYCSSILPERIICGIATAGREDGAAGAGHGDSGGPAYITSPSLSIAGTIVGAASAQFVCPRNSEGGTRTCSTYVRYQMINSILTRWSGSHL